MSEYLGDWTRRKVLAAATGAALVGYADAGIGAVKRSVQQKVADLVSVKDFGAVGDGVANDAAAIQAAHDAIVASGKKGRLFLPAGTYKCNAGITLNALYVAIDAAGAALDFSGLAAGTALTVTEHDLVDLGGMRLTGNSNAGVVVGLRMTGAAGHQVDSVRLVNAVIKTFGTGVLLGSYAYLLTFDNVNVSDCTVNIDSQGVTNAGSSVKWYGGNLVNAIAGGTVFKNTNSNLDAYFFGTVIDGKGKNFDLSGGSVQLFGCHLEAADFLVPPIQITGASARFAMMGGLLSATANPVTAQTLITCDASAVHGVLLSDDVLIATAPASGYLFGGTGAGYCRSRGSIAAARHSAAGNLLCDGGFENGAVLYGSANGSNGFADMVAITVDTGALPAANRVTGTNLALTFSTAQARAGAKSLKLTKTAALNAPAAFGIFAEVEQGKRCSGRIYYTKPGAEVGDLYISMGYYKLDLDANGVPVLQKQSLTQVTHAVFGAAAVGWTEASLFDLYVPPWATHYGITANAGSMPASALYFDDAEINAI